MVDFLFNFIHYSGDPMLEEGQKCPQFSSVDQDGNEVKLKDFKGKKLVLFFYPKDMTPGCTTEACDFRDSYKKIVKKGVEVLGVSRDSQGSHIKFREKHQLPFTLLSDEDESVCRAFDVIQEKNMYGKKVMGIVRSTFLINEKGVVEKIWWKVKVAGHVDEVMSHL
jgi:peroxiredoxin Q/BCP